jgi:hypothetical protein
MGAASKRGACLGCVGALNVFIRAELLLMRNLFAGEHAPAVTIPCPLNASKPARSAGFEGFRSPKKNENSNRDRLCAACAADGLDDLRRQAEADIFRHHFYFFDAGKPF